jgi:hypothetical protein
MLLLRVCWYQKNALIGFLGAFASRLRLTFFSGFSGFADFLAGVAAAWAGDSKVI